jgi:hypothetical protein
MSTNIHLNRLTSVAWLAALDSLTDSELDDYAWHWGLHLLNHLLHCYLLSCDTLDLHLVQVLNLPVLLLLLSNQVELLWLLQEDVLGLGQVVGVGRLHLAAMHEFDSVSWVHWILVCVKFYIDNLTGPNGF